MNLSFFFFLDFIFKRMGGGQTKEEKELSQRIKSLKKEGGKVLHAENIGIVQLKKKAFAHLKDLTEIHLAQNKLIELPPEISLLSKLEICNLRFFFFQSLFFKPSNFFKNTSQNELASLPSEIGALVNLMKLTLESNKLSTLPNEFGKVQNLTELNLSSNKLTSLPEDFAKLEKLTLLNLSTNSFETFPVSVVKLKSLKELDFSNNSVKELPDSIGELESVVCLNFNKNRLEKLSASGLIKLTKLEKLDLSCNGIEEIPSNLCKIPNLIELNISENLLLSLPDELVTLFFFLKTI